LGAQKRKTAVFGVKSHFALRKSATKFLCANCQRQNRNAFIGLTIRAKMIDVRRPLLRENLAHTDPPALKTPTFDLFSPVAPQP